MLDFRSVIRFRLKNQMCWLTCLNQLLVCTKISKQQKQSYIIRYKPLQLPESPLRPRDPNINSWPAPISSRLGLLAYYQQAQSLLRGDFWPQCMGRSMTVSRLRPVLNTTEPEGLWQWEDCDEDLYMTINFWWIYTWPIKRKHSQSCQDYEASRIMRHWIPPPMVKIWCHL